MKYTLEGIQELLEKQTREQFDEYPSADKMDYELFVKHSIQDYLDNTKEILPEFKGAKTTHKMILIQRLWLAFKKTEYAGYGNIVYNYLNDYWGEIMSNSFSEKEHVVGVDLPVLSYEELTKLWSIKQPDVPFSEDSMVVSNRYEYYFRDSIVNDLCYTENNFIEVKVSGVTTNKYCETSAVSYTNPNNKRLLNPMGNIGESDVCEMQALQKEFSDELKQRVLIDADDAFNITMFLNTEIFS